jgi:hypothetical protein
MGRDRPARQCFQPASADMFTSLGQGHMLLGVRPTIPRQDLLAQGAWANVKPTNRRAPALVKNFKDCRHEDIKMSLCLA